MSSSIAISHGKVLYSSENFQVVTHPEKEAHLMILSKGPCGCSGALSDALFDELCLLKDFVSSSIEQPVWIYEYGMKSSSSLQLSILLHEPEGLYENLIKKVDPLILKEFQEVPTMYDRFGDYIYFETADKQKYFFCIENITA